MKTNSLILINVPVISNYSLKQWIKMIQFIGKNWLFEIIFWLNAEDGLLSLKVKHNSDSYTVYLKERLVLPQEINTKSGFVLREIYIILELQNY